MSTNKIMDIVKLIEWFRSGDAASSVIDRPHITNDKTSTCEHGRYYWDDCSSCAFIDLADELEQYGEKVIK